MSPPLKLGRKPMIRRRLPYVWAMSVDLEALEKLDRSKDWDRFDLMFTTLDSRNALERLLTGSVFTQALRSSRPLGEGLLAQLDAVSRGDVDKQVTKYEVSNIAHYYGQFKIALLAELDTFPAYFVTQKGDRDTLTLLDQPLRMFPDDLGTKVPEARYDVAEAGKALCYELATACGYHLFRATEAVLRRYYTHVTGGNAPPKIRNIMAIRTAKCGDERILSVIEQMSKLHRNPIAHPEVALTLDEAISILGIARSAVTAMLMALPTPPKTTTDASAVPAASASGTS
jgi:hypothetical protein